MQSSQFRHHISCVRQGYVLAPALFCRAIDWIMERVVSTVGFSLGNDHFTDLDYADDVALLAHAIDDLHTALDIFETTAYKLGLHVSWQKTKIQNLGAGDSNISNLSVSRHSVGEVTEFTYLGSVLSTTGRCQPDIFRRIGIASSTMHSINRVWRQTRLQLQTKLRLNQTCLLPILLHGSEAGTLLQKDLYTEARGLPYALPVYDPWNSLVRFCQKHRGHRHHQSSQCPGHHHQELKLTVRSCDET